MSDTRVWLDGREGTVKPEPTHVLICLLGQVCGVIFDNDEIAAVDLVRIHINSFSNHGPSLRLCTVATATALIHENPEYEKQLQLAFSRHHPLSSRARIGRSGGFDEPVRLVAKQLFAPASFDDVDIMVPF